MKLNPEKAFWTLALASITLSIVIYVQGNTKIGMSLFSALVTAIVLSLLFTADW